MLLAAFGGRLTSHDMLAAPFAAILSHGDTFSSPLEASEACPRKKREQPQGNYSHGPEAMSLKVFHSVVS
jgi:hypothetical protein